MRNGKIFGLKIDELALIEPELVIRLMILNLPVIASAFQFTVRNAEKTQRFLQLVDSVWTGSETSSSLLCHLPNGLKLRCQRLYCVR